MHTAEVQVSSTASPHPVDAWLAITLVREHSAVGRRQWEVVIREAVPLAITVREVGVALVPAALLSRLVVGARPGARRAASWMIASHC